MVMMVWEMHLRLFQLQQVLPSLHLKVSAAVHVMQHEGLSTGLNIVKQTCIPSAAYCITDSSLTAVKSQASTCGGTGKV